MCNREWVQWVVCYTQTANAHSSRRWHLLFQTAITSPSDFDLVLSGIAYTTIPLLTSYHIWFANMTNTMTCRRWQNGQSTEINHINHTIIFKWYYPSSSFWAQLYSFEHTMLNKSTLLNGLAYSYSCRVGKSFFVNRLFGWFVWMNNII